MSHKIEVVAEAGICHNGDMYRAFQMICTAKECGADTVKFQVYDPETTLDKTDPILSPCWDTILETKLSFKDVEFLKSCCDDRGIGFLASAFDVERVGWLTKLGVERYKIAARQCRDIEVARAIAKTGRPVILSWPAPYYDYHTAAIRQFPSAGPIRQLWCVSEYPTPLNHLGFWHNCFEDHDCDGFSDHTIGITASVMAMSLGATIIEKHFTLDKSLPGPDHICSAEPQELLALCRARDDIEQILYKEQE